MAVGKTGIKFLSRDIGKQIPEMQNFPGFDHVVSVFTLEEIAAENTPLFFSNMAKAIHRQTGQVHIFTQHPAYALQQDVLSTASVKPNDKFQGHEGYFDTRPTTYNLGVLNRENGVEAKPSYHHKPLALIINALTNAGLFCRR